MIAVVIPAKNEAENICATLDNLRSLPIDVIIPVLNGCTDHTKQTLQKHGLYKKIKLMEFKEPLGIDVPRAVGALYARRLGARAVLFIDGDIRGDLSPYLYQLIKAVTNDGWDLALANCYPYIGYRSTVAKEVVHYREQLNRTLGVFTKLGLATPSHGPHCLSEKLLQRIDIRALAVPPMVLALAVEQGLGIGVATSLTDDVWHSQQRGDKHNGLIAETIIGDCIQARQYFLKQPIDRTDQGKTYLGYHKDRRMWWQ